MQNVRRNQLEMWQDQLEMQQDRDKLQRQRQRHESHLLDQMHRLGVVADNMSSDHVEEYQAQITDQIHGLNDGQSDHSHLPSFLPIPPVPVISAAHHMEHQ